MKHFMFAVLVGMVTIGCSSTPYSTVKTGPDRYTLTGHDPNQLRANAFKACRDDGFDDYSVVDSNKTSWNVQCEKTPQSFFSQVSEKTEKAWEYVKNKVDDYRKESEEKKVDNTTNK